MKVKNNELESLHGALLRMVKEIHRLCVENGIQYTMLAGTMLGAIRHKGFIPWDDDIDLGMTYDNYKKFVELMGHLNHPWLETDYPLESHHNYYVKVYDKTTTFIEKDHQNEIRGVFVDVFPIVNAGDSLSEVKRRIAECSFYKALLSRKLGTIEGKTIKDRLFELLSKCFSKRLLYKLLICSYNRADSKRRKYSTVLFSWNKDHMPTELYEHVVLYGFEDTKLYGVQDYEKYLSDKFGDYLKLPPKDKQHPLHFSYLDLNTPYSQYVQA